ncbi:neuraminidase-like domain-containing protein [Dyadobacter sp. NIV53]|uniref:neuraminidase-like domain-containing protein n=1 Tax=Dyadobacter sp. NIV53 TaxID=2861765 RepID=UPI001C889EBD|nr:neuraminidase-like domain-containing protein [Dyadobacter sp. NIV53]
MPRPIQFHISGVIHSEHDAPLSNVTVQVLYKDLRSEKLLIATQTDAQGKYENFFNPTLVHVSESRPVDIFLKVFSGRTLLGTSPVLYNVGPKIDYDFKIGGGAYTGKSEYERILEKVAPIALANQVELGELVENEEHQDISFLAGETGETAEDITFLNLAHRLTKEQGNIAPDIYYACAKAGMPTNLRNLLLTKADAIQNAIEGGIDKNTISSKWRPEIKKVVGRFNSLASKQVLIGDDKQSVLFRKTLGSVLTEAEQNVFADTLFNHEQEEPAKFWENLKLKPGFTDGKAIEKAKKLLALNTLTSGQPELTNHLFKLQGNDPDLAEASGFAKFSEEDWQEHIRKAAVIDFPDWVTGDSVEEQTQFYAAALENRNKQLYPTPFFASRLKKDTQSTFAHQRDIQQFLLKNPEFDLKTTHFQKAFNQAALEGISDRNGLETELKTVVRLSKLADDYEKVSALQRKGISSATDAVHKFGEAQFEKEFAGQLGGATNASKIYRRAVSVHNKTSLIKVGDQARNNLKMYALGGNLISGGDLCECEECQSVLSPAAYFVDVLAFIRNADKDQATYDKLIERRPDLPYILLTCKNTNSPLPYIDLVNELLEKEVLKKLDPDRLMKNSYQSEGSAAELVALPEHVNPAAYEPLKGISGDTVFSQALPLDLSLEEVRVYSEKLGWQRYQLMEVFSGNQLSAKWNDPALARELLGFSGAELDIISGRTPFSLPEMDQAETTIQSLLTLTGLSYVELLQLLGTYFLNPKTNTGRMKIFQKVAGDNENVLTCNLNELFISGFNNAWLHKLTRFVRLWKGIKWDLYDLDQVLTTLLDNPAFPETAQFETKILLPLARVETISRQLHLTHSQTITLIAPISTALYLDHTKAAQPEIPSLYTQLFRNRLVSELEGSPFTENPDQLTGLLWSHKDPIGAALNVSVGDIAVLEQSGEVLSLASLSRVYREVLLSKTLRISLANLQLIQTAFGLRAADTGWDAADLIDFLEHYEIFKSTRVPIQKLLETLGSKVGEDYRLPLDDTFISSIIDFSNRLTPPEGEEAEDKDSIIREIIAFFTNNATLKSALAGPLTNPDDLSIKKTITAFIDPTESEILFKLPASQIAAQLRSLSDFVDAYLLCKVTPMLLKDWGFDMAEIKWMHDNRNRLGIAALWNEIPALNPEVYHAWISLFHLSKLNKERTDKTVSLISLLNTALSENTGAKAAYFTQFVKIFAIREESLELLAGTKNDFDDKGQLWLSFPDDFLRVKPLLDLLESNKTLVSLGASATQVAALLNPEPGPSDAKSVRNLLKTKYTNDQWLDIIKPISNRLRRRRKNALVKFLINKDDRWTSADDLYHHLLIDTEMETCMMTSRLKQAIGSVQLFIHRCLMNLEVGITLSSEFEKEWHEWRKAYRVWEANRKIFLYPENWIEPDLRDNKSPFFLELESQLKQSEVTEETAKDALQSYLEKLDKVSNLEMVGLFDDQEMGILHVLGRTQTLPHQYYYRTQQNGEWSAWTKVDLDINSDHIIMVVWNSRLLILWGEFTEKQGKGGSTSISNPADGPMTMSSTEAPTYFEMKLPWSEYKKGKWGGKKISKEVAVLDNTYGKANWSLSSRLLNGNLLIRIVETRPPAKEKKIGPVIYTQLFLGTFEFDSCNGSPKLKPTTTNGLLPEKLRMIKDVVPDGIWMKETILKDSFSLMNSGVAKSLLFKTKFTENELFESTPGQFRLLPNHHQIEAQKTISFFFNNEKNTFFARSSDRLLPLLSVDDNVPHILARETNHSTLNPAENETSPAQHYIKKEYTFQTFYHPHACELIRKLNVEGVDALYAHQETDQEKELFTADRYNPTNFVLKPYPVETLDFKFGGAYSLYNWELFYHAPLLIATRLAQNQRFLEALKWYHYIFNPTQSAGSGTDGEQFWITKPFKQEIRNGIQPIEELLLDEHFVDELNRQIEYWEHNPFNPHAVARTRQFAYMLRVVTLYIDNLIQWGDQLFQRDTIESINEATLLYTLASNILGKRKERVPARAVVSEKSFSDIFEKLDPFHNSLAELEIYINPSGDGPNTGRMLMPVFGIPGNDLVLKYWDTVADRLFKIRNCMNLQGEVRQLPLFEPPIDPALLVKGRAAGLDLNSILNDMNISLPNY